MFGLARNFGCGIAGLGQGVVANEAFNTGLTRLETRYGIMKEA